MIPSRRKQFLINPKFQLAFLSYVLGIAIVTIGVFFAAKVAFFAQVTGFLHEMGFRDNHVIFEFLQKQSTVMNLIFAAAAVIESVFLVVAGILLSHRVAGPLYRLREDMLRIAEGGPLNDVQFRKKDFFQEVPEAYNRQLARFRKTQ